MKSITKLVLLLCHLYLAAPALAAPQSSAVYTTEQLQLLATHPTWLKLGHYETGFLSSLRSEVTSDSFFIAKEGKSSPLHELQATISEMQVKVDDDNKSAQCRFPARRLWLIGKLPKLTSQLPPVNCTEYKQHRIDNHADQISLVYASGYLGNPASMYGHLLLKLKNNNNELLENTFNYGAMVPPKENKLKYITLGILGGYQARFSSEEFHRHSHIYNESELRDLWEYELNLTQNDITFLLAHHWELKTQTFTYYFFKQNCAYQIAKLLELVVDLPLMNDNKPWVMPYDVISGITKEKPSGGSVVDKIRRHESRQESLSNKYHQLNREEQSTVKAIASTNSTSLKESLSPLSLLEKNRVIDTLFDYYSFLKISQSELSKQDTEKKRQLLAQRFSLPPAKTTWKTPNKNPPHQSQYPTMLQLSPTYNDKLGSGLQLRFRASYYDLLSLDAGRLPFSSLAMFDLKVIAQDDKLTLKSWDLFNIENLSVSNTGLAGDGGYSWSLRAGVHNIDLTCNDCLVTNVSGAFGKSYRINEQTAFYSMVDGRVQVPDRQRGHLKAGIKSGLVSQLTPYWRTSVSVGYHYYLDNTEQHSHSINWEQRFGDAKSWDVRTQYRYDGASELSLSYSYYW
ncbi:DUF4105 domain-containing protein [Psychrobium sp. 1_MG-2023]|uniref:Lnb N-terminal periplasmic domain-containing protein n=1 Tax=Psychrobium sp. 1_MG-2023 TaxID=3062624 RepID=UPI000C3321C1|nr:DUF4105 domain-containing protein [Psychrobium sp. 1_MG-2023]MDP2561638.1 DUF4105 domain-containing protein [Psychrobium sp. 1_MG-2023]PKF55655.1 hypothetical protein CW748_12420 [Alteromonadales bacterium alter-6D02]